MTPGQPIRFLRNVPSAFTDSPPLCEYNEVGELLERDDKGRWRVRTERGAEFISEDGDFEVIE